MRNRLALSSIWDYFTKNDHTGYCMCKSCPKVYKLSAVNRSHSVLWYHLILKNKRHSVQTKIVSLGQCSPASSPPSTPESQEAECLKTPEKCDIFFDDDLPPVTPLPEPKPKKKRKVVILNKTSPTKSVSPKPLSLLPKLKPISISPPRTKPTQIVFSEGSNNRSLGNTKLFASTVPAVNVGTAAMTAAAQTAASKMSPVRGPVQLGPRPGTAKAHKTQSAKVSSSHRQAKGFNPFAPASQVAEVTTTKPVVKTVKKTVKTIKRKKPEVKKPAPPSQEMDDFEKELQLLNAALDAAPATSSYKPNTTPFIDDEEDLFADIEEILLEERRSLN